MRRLTYILISLFVLCAFLSAFAADAVECVWKLEMLDESSAESENSALLFGVASVEKRGSTASPGFPTPDKTLKFFAWNISSPLNTQWWPEASPDAPYLYSDYTQKVAAKDALQFARDWHLVVYTVEEDDSAKKIAPATHTYRLSLSSGTFPSGSKIIIRRDSDNEVIATMPSDATESVEFELLGGMDDGTTFAPVYYTVSVECSMVETAYTYHLSSGWNLIGIPFAQVLNASALFDAGGVFTPNEPWTQLTQTDNLECGRAYWVFNENPESIDAEVTGRVYTNATTAFPDGADGWRDAAIVAQWSDEQQRFVSPTEKQIVTRWNGQSFERVNIIPEFGAGYFIR